MGTLVACLVVAGVLGAIGYLFFADRRDQVDTSKLITQPVSRGSFDHIVLEQGEIESSSNIEVVCQVKSRGSGGTSILWVIPEGTRVKKGEKLVELDASQLEQQLNEDKIRVIAAKANVTTAKAQVEQAKIARQEYLEGVFKTEERALLSTIAVNEQELRKAQLALESSKRLVAKGLVKELQLEADQFAVANARNQLEAAQGELKVLQELTREKMLVQFDSDIESAQAQLSAYQSELLEEEAQLAETEEQIENCVIRAPASGVVVHANRYSRRGGNAEFVVEAGANVRERQPLIRLPDPTQMQVKCKINESRITLIDEGMPVKISVDAIPGLELKGRVSKVNRYAEPGSFFSSSIKEYAVEVDILDPPDVIRTGMTAEVQIFVEQLDKALQIPIQGLYEHGNQMYALVQESPTDYRTAEIEIGATNDTMATITEGLEEGESVVLNLREHLSLMDLPEVVVEDNSDMKEIANLPRDGERAGAGAAGEPRGGDGPSDRPGGAAAAPGPGGAGPGGTGPGGAGPGGAGPGGGGRPNPATIVSRIMENVDTSGDGTISAEEMQSLPAQRQQSLQRADKDGDGSVSRQELTEQIQQRMGG